VTRYRAGHDLSVANGPSEADERATRCSICGTIIAERGAGLIQ